MKCERWIIQQDMSMGQRKYLSPRHELNYIDISDPSIKVSVFKSGYKYRYIYLGWRHSNVWHSSPCELYSSDTNTVNIWLHVISLEILSKEGVYWCIFKLASVSYSLVIWGYISKKKGNERNLWHCCIVQSAWSSDLIWSPSVHMGQDCQRQGNIIDVHLYSINLLVIQNFV